MKPEKVTLIGEWARYARNMGRVEKRGTERVVQGLDLKDPELAQKVRKELGRAIPLHPKVRQV